MRKTKIQPVNQPALEDSIFTGAFEKMDYIQVGTSRDIAKSTIKKCFERPGFMSQGQRILFGRQSVHKF